MTDAGARPRSARLWRIAAGLSGGLLILAAVLLGGLRLLVAQLPGNAGRVQAWIEQQTHLRIEYRGLDARLRWFGPEVVLRDVRVLDTEGTGALFATREGSVGLDLWNLFRTGQLVAGRVRFVGPHLTVVRLPDGRIRLLGQLDRPSDRPPFDLDRLPAGRVSIEDATVVYRDLKTGRGPWTLTDLQLSLRRDRDFVTTEGSASLPPSLGGRIEFDGRLNGSLHDFDRLEAHVELRTSRLLLPGVAGFLPAGVAVPRAGSGGVDAVVSVVNGRLKRARLDLDLAGVVLDLPARTPQAVTAVQVSAPYAEPGSKPMTLPVMDIDFVERAPAALPRQARYDVLAGRLRLRHDSEAWQLQVEDLRTDRATRLGQPAASVDARLRGNPVTIFDLQLQASHVSLARLWPLVLACAPSSFDRWSGLAPTGVIRDLQLDLRRVRAGAIPQFTVSADVSKLGIRPVGRLPGVSGVTAVLKGSDAEGRGAVRSSNAAFELPRVFLHPLAAQKLVADLDWHRSGRVWTLASKSFFVDDPIGRARGSFRIDLPGGKRSPVLVISAQVERGDATAAGKVLPVSRLKPRTLAWLERAFLAGQISNGRFDLSGPTRKFPFRNGGGEFKASADVRGASLDYFAGFAPITDAVGKVEFHNAGLRAEVSEAQVAGLRIAHAVYTLPDYHEGLMLVDAGGSGDVGKALTYLQTSPLGPTLGHQFMGLTGRGPADFTVNLTLPASAETDVQRDYLVRASLRSVMMTLPALRAPAQKVTGGFELHNYEMRSTGLTGTLLGGPFRATIAPGPLTGGATAAIEFRGEGRVAGAQLPGFIGLPDGVRMGGTADWQLVGRLERRGQGDAWPLRIDVTSPLMGLEIVAPQPFAKGVAESRPTHVRVEVPTDGVDDVGVESGSARAKLRFASGAGGKWTLERGLARFDGQPVSLPPRPGLLVAGDWPQFDLGEWLALGSRTSGGPRLSEWLGPVDVHLDRALVAGFEFRDVSAHLRSSANGWQVGVDGPMAAGNVIIPDDVSGGRPIELQMQRLQLLSPPAVPGKAGEPVGETDPRTLPALTVNADDFTWEGRRFGHIKAVISKDPQGLRFDTLASSSPDFTVNARGGWLMEGQASRTRLALEFNSTDLAAASRSLGYRDAVDAKKAKLTADVNWAGGPSSDALGRLDGTLRLDLNDGQLRDVKPGAGRVLGLMSVVELPRRLSLDFRDVTDKGLAFDKVRGDFELRKGDAFTQNLLLKGTAVDVGVVGRTGLATEDYDQTVVVSGNTSGPIVAAGALAGGPVGAAGALVFSQLFKGQLKGLMRVYYHVTGPWSNPVIERISAPASENAAETPKDKGGNP